MEAALTIQRRDAMGQSINTSESAFKTLGTRLMGVSETSKSTAVPERRQCCQCCCQCCPTPLLRWPGRAHAKKDPQLASTAWHHQVLTSLTLPPKSILTFTPSLHFDPL